MIDASLRAPCRPRPPAARALLLATPFVLAACATTTPSAHPRTGPPSAQVAQTAAPEARTELPPLTAEDASVSARMTALQAIRAERPTDIEAALLLAETAELQGRLLQESGRPSAQAFQIGVQAAGEAEEQLSKTAEAAPERVAQARCLKALNGLGWSRQEGFVEQVDQERSLRATFQSLLEDPVWGRAARRALADMLARPLDLSQRDLQRSKAIFEALVSEDPWDFHSRVLFARAYAVSAQDQAVYEAQLKEIVVRTSGEQGVAIERHIAARAATRELRLAPSLFE